MLAIACRTVDLACKKGADFRIVALYIMLVSKKNSLLKRLYYFDMKVMTLARVSFSSEQVSIYFEIFLNEMRDFLKKALSKKTSENVCALKF